MDIFQNLFRAFSGKKNELDKPVFAKKYVDKSEDLLALSARLDAAPESMKPVYRDAMEALGEQMKAHRRVQDILEECGLPIVVLCDLHILSPRGAAVIDFVILSNRYALAVSCQSSTDLPLAEKKRKSTDSGVNRRLTAAEDCAYILKELMRESRLLNKRELNLIWPVSILPGADKDSLEATARHQDRKREPDEINDEIVVAPQNFAELLKNMFRIDDNMTFISNDKVFSVAKLLLEYEKSSSCAADKNE